LEFESVVYFVKVRLKVIQYWKGRAGSDVDILSEQGVLSCNLFQFQKGAKYLVYAYGKRLVVFTGSSRSAPLSWGGYVNDELKMLAKVGSGTPFDFCNYDDAAAFYLWTTAEPCNGYRQDLGPGIRLQ
jgi:hypothetical protein